MATEQSLLGLEFMIPKKIHYVWVGTQPKSELILKCIASWKKYLPDYEIIEWDNVKFEQIKNPYSEQAFANKKWAFVSDYIRLYALYHEGGIYLDSDLEITQSIDPFLHHDFFSGYEIYNNIYSPITALMGAQKHNTIIEALLGYYLNAEFETAEGLDLEPNTARISHYFAEAFGLSKPYDGNQTSKLSDNSVIYPSSFFCTPEAGKENYAIHHFNGSWLDGYRRKNKFSLFNKFIIARFKKNTHANSSLLPLLNNEKLVFSLATSKGKRLGLILKQ